MAGQKYIVHDFRGANYPAWPKIRWLGVEQDTLERIAKPELEQFRREAEERRNTLVGERDPRKVLQNSYVLILDQVLLNPRMLRAETGVDPLPYFYMVACVKDGLRGNLGAPMVRGDVDKHRAGWRGNWSNILPAHMPLMLLYATKSGVPQEMLMSKFGVDQSTVSRHLAVILELLTDVKSMPTAVAVADEIGGTPLDEVVEALGHVINFDVTEFRIEAPADPGSNDAAYSGKVGATTAKAAFLCSSAGLLMAMGDVMPGRRHDITALRESIPFLGNLTKSITDPDTPAADRLTINADKGAIGADKHWPGADLRVPTKKARGQKRLPPNARQRNYEINSDRAIIENVFREMKVYRAIGGIFRGSVRSLSDTVLFVTGVVNLQRMMGCRDPSRTHRKHRKPGPKTPRSRGRKPRKTFE